MREQTVQEYFVTSERPGEGDRRYLHFHDGYGLGSAAPVGAVTDIRTRRSWRFIKEDVLYAIDEDRAKARPRHT